MIEIKVRRHGKTRKISVKGHAKKGNDIVCAAVSCITCAFLISTHTPHARRDIKEYILLR